MASFYNPRYEGMGLLMLLVLLGAASFTASASDRKNYIVYMGELPLPSSLETFGFSSVSDQHVHMLRQASDINSFQASNLVHSYHRSFNGFVARLTKAEAERLAGMEGVASVFPSEIKQLHTTRSWDFMGIFQTAKRSRLESDVIVGILDSGVCNNQLHSFWISHALRTPASARFTTLWDDGVVQVRSPVMAYPLVRK